MFKGNGGARSELVEDIIDFFNMRQSVTRLIGSFFSVIILLHVMACLWFFIAKLEGLGPDSWVVRGGYMEATDGEIYVASFYWALTTLTTVGYGDISAETFLERIFAMIIMFTGVLYISFVVSNLTSMMTQIDHMQVVLSGKMDFIDQFSKTTSLDKDLRMRLKHALRYSTEKLGYNWAD